VSNDWRVARFDHVLPPLLDVAAVTALREVV